MGGSNAAIEKQRIKEYNTALKTNVAAFAEAHPDLHVMTFDAHAWFTQILDNAEDYGFKNTTG